VIGGMTHDWEQDGVTGHIGGIESDPGKQAAHPQQASAVGMSNT